ncbi:MAG: glycosyltransferase [Candidatus Magnetomorum sp.]|nr:glycosyltransferase [Candidatus Magnetomorum sp.]
MDKSKAYVSNINALEEKETVIQNQHKQLIEKEVVIHKLANLNVFSYFKNRLRRFLMQIDQSHDRFLFRSFRFILNTLKRKSKNTLFLTPKLGILRQYPPRNIKHCLIPIKTPAFMPSISIITPSYNQSQFIEKTILSILNQKYQNLEYGIQDGGSNDGTCFIINKYRNSLLFFETKTDNGQSHAINLGFKKTTGEIMAWLNSDDILLPDSLNYVANFFSKHPEVDVIYGHRIIIDAHDKEIGRWILPTHNKSVLYWADFIPQETLFWRRTIWENVGGYVDETYQFAMDWDLLLRFQCAGANIVRVPYFLGAFRVHDRQKTTTAISQMGWPEMNRLRRKYLNRDVLPDEIFHHTKRYLIRHMLFDISWRFKSIFAKECSKNKFPILGGVLKL